MACGSAPHTKLIIGIRDVHTEVSAWTSRTTLRWWTASKTTCSTAQDSVRHLAGNKNASTNPWCGSGFQMGFPPLMKGSTPGGALPSIASCFRLATMLLPEPGTLISQLDPSWFGLRPFSRARICDLTSKAQKAPPQLGTHDLHLVTAVAVFLVHTEHDAWHVVPSDNRRENHMGSIVAGKSSLAHTASVVSVLSGVLQCLGSCGHVHPC